MKQAISLQNEYTLLWFWTGRITQGRDLPRKSASHPSWLGPGRFPQLCSWKPTTPPLQIRRCEAAPPSPDGQPGRTPDEIRSLSTQLSQRARLHETGDRVPARAFRRPQEVQESRVGGTPAEREEHRPDLREGLDSYALRLRSRRPRSGRPRDLSRSGGVADRAQGVDEGHGPRARPNVRRHRIPRLRPVDRRDPRRVCRRAGVERVDERIPSNPVAGGHADDAGTRGQTPRTDRLRLR